MMTTANTDRIMSDLDNAIEHWDLVTIKGTVGKVLDKWEKEIEEAEKQYAFVNQEIPRWVETLKKCRKELYAAALFDKGGKACFEGLKTLLEDD
jgi:Fic family protein